MFAFRGFETPTLSAPVQHADEGKKPPGGVEIQLDLALQPFLQGLRTFVVNTAPAHVDSLDTVRRCRLDGLVIALADHEVVFHDPPEGRQRENMGGNRVAVFKGDIEDESFLGNGERQLVGAAVMPDRLEMIFLQQVENGDCALVFDIGRGAADALIENNIA